MEVVVVAIDKRKLSGGIKYRARYQGAYATFTRKTDAKQWEANQKVEHEMSKYMPSKIEERTVTELFKIWTENHAEINKAQTSVIRDKQIFRDYIEPSIGKYKCHQIKGSQIESIVTSLKRECRLKDKSINNIITLIKTIFNYGISKIKLSEQAFNYWDKEDVQKFLRFAKNKYVKDKTTYVFYLTSLNTGMRLGEVTGLKWDYVDLERRIITVGRTYDAATKGIKETTKGRRIRYVGINDVLFPELKELRQKNPGSEFVFSNLAGNFIDPKNFRSRRFEKDVAEAGVKRIRIHDMRHTAASNFVSNKGQIYDLKELLGHQDIKTTMNYAHLSPDHVAKKASIINYGTDNLKEPEDNVISFVRKIG